MGWQATRAVIVLAGVLLAATQVCGARTLVINANTSDPSPRAAWESAVAGFRAEHPGIEVELNVYDHESYKRSIRNWLTSVSPDVVFWFAGTRMRQFVAAGLLADVSALFTPAVKAALPEAAVALVSAGGRQYGVPYAYYQVGLYFRSDLMAKAGVAAPVDWAQLLAACDKLKAAGVVPFAIGSKDLWPAAAWFDYLNLRGNGHDFHMALMNGRVSWLEPRVRATFGKWRELVARDCFAKGHVSMSWQESAMLLHRGEAAMMLIGNYIVPTFPADVRPQMDFAPFPTIEPAFARHEEAPTNSIHIPARARNKADAQRFLAYVLRANVQEAIARSMLLIPANLDAALVDDRFVRKGRDLIRSADKLSQFLDRDTDEGLAAVAMKGFQEFMVHPDRLDRILANIERARAQVYRN